MNHFAKRLSIGSNRLFAVALATMVVGLLVFGVLGASILHGNSLARLDFRLNVVIRRGMPPDSTDLFHFISLLGFQILAVVGVLVGIFLALKRRWLYMAVWGTAWAGGIALNPLLKRIFARPWPFLAHSFPSGHAMFAVIAYGLLAYFALSKLDNQVTRVVVVVGTVTLVLLIGLSRIYLGVHYVSDVVGGFAIGAVWLMACITATEAIKLATASDSRQ